MKLKEIRKRKNLTQKDMANFLNITTQAYANYEQGIREPTIPTLKKLATFFNVSLDYLCDYDIGESKQENIKLFSDIKNKCYNLLVSMSEEQAKLTYSYMLGVTGQELII